ncbi:septum site-determining protein MinC [Kovacikia minuta CCNUW1]|uniref:septum site-determining protein MinC n=1 Tax=Kovacikia minuta TaxID=2931930 RepID=UPI001CCBE050|nr:septum site-determining protein MinC [Kovacikia minuta]UBF29386.1 septum site-determining protein MinC [Kovacikia minuta CCNUW1]
MTDASSSSIPIVPEDSVEVDRDQQVRLKSEGGKILLLLPPEGEGDESDSAMVFTWDEIWHQFKQRLNAGDRFWQPDTTVHLIARDRLLDVRQLQAIADALTDVQLQLKRVYTSRRQTAVAAATAGYSVEQQPSIAHLNQSSQESGQALADPLYLETTLRSGADIRHNGTVVVLGDLNPGSSVTAEGDILVWGRLRGVAHAGSKGNARCLIMALKMEPTQIRIADFVARAPEAPPAQYYPEVAYVTPKGSIHIASAINFSRSQTKGSGE